MSLYDRLVGKYNLSGWTDSQKKLYNQTAKKKTSSSASGGGGGGAFGNNVTEAASSVISSVASSMSSKNISNSGGSKSYTASSGSSSGGGGSSTKTTTKKETYYERTTTTQDTVETTTITYQITKNGKDTLDDGSKITNIRLFDNSPSNKFFPQTEGIGLDDLFSSCEWNVSGKKEQGDALTTNYTEEQFKSAITNPKTLTNGGKRTSNNIGETGNDIGRIVFNNNDFSYIFSPKSSEYKYDPKTDSYIKNTQKNPTIKYVKKDNISEVTLTYYEDIIRPELNSEWASRVKDNERPSFAQIYKKLNDDEIINSISISTTSKFRDYMSQVWGTSNDDGSITPLDLDAEAKNGNAKHVLTLFIDNITLHEAKHIPLFYPNVRMKFYHSNNKPDDVDTYNLRKMGAVIEYR